MRSRSQYGLQVSLAISILLGAVAISYRQICIAYPTGGGSYSVSKRNFGRNASLVAASALLIDYTLTVAVSTSSAVEQITSAVPALVDERVIIGVVAIGLITLGNLRGLREAGNIFAIPTYLFVFSALLMIGIGTFRIVVLGEHAAFSQADVAKTGGTLEAVGLLLFLRAFAAGSVALTGTEAIATGVPAFKPPEARNAATTLAVMAGLLGILFVGITFLAVNFGITHVDLPEKQTVISQVAAKVYGSGTLAFFLFQAFTALLLFLAANTSLQRVPAAARDPRDRWLHAASVRVPRRPPGVQLRDRRAGGRRRIPAHRVPWRDPPADPAVLGRGVHRFHDQPERA